MTGQSQDVGDLHGETIGLLADGLHVDLLHHVDERQVRGVFARVEVLVDQVATPLELVDELKHHSECGQCFLEAGILWVRILSELDQIG